MGLDALRGVTRQRQVHGLTGRDSGGRPAQPAARTHERLRLCAGRAYDAMDRSARPAHSMSGQPRPVADSNRLGNEEQPWHNAENAPASAARKASAGEGAPSSRPWPESSYARHTAHVSRITASGGGHRCRELQLSGCCSELEECWSNGSHLNSRPDRSSPAVVTSASITSSGSMTARTGWTSRRRGARPHGEARAPTGTTPGVPPPPASSQQCAACHPSGGRRGRPQWPTGGDCENRCPITRAR